MKSNIQNPTLGETTAFVIEMAEGTITDLLPPKEKKVGYQSGIIN